MHVEPAVVDDVQGAVQSLWEIADQLRVPSVRAGALRRAG
jgi:hypothetical protein